jgi:prepilin-type N-terminal cleavage/methylation domain-containing protein
VKRGFSVTELMIVVAVLGILAAIVVPRFQSHATRAKEAVAKDSLRILRSAIELYTTQHGGIPPGYQDDDPDTVPSSSIFSNQLVLEGRYVLKMPENPFNGLKTTLVIANNGTFPNAATGTYGWVYQPATITIRLDWPGTDKTGLRYYDY